MAALSGHLHRPAQAYGEVLINGVPPQQSSIKPTYFSAWDEPMTSLTIEQVLIYTGVQDGNVLQQHVATYGCHSLQGFMLPSNFGPPLLHTAMLIASSVAGPCTEDLPVPAALLKWQDQPKAALEQEVRKVCQMLGLLGDLGSLTREQPPPSALSLPSINVPAQRHKPCCLQPSMQQSQLVLPDMHVQDACLPCWPPVQ